MSPLKNVGSLQRDHPAEARRSGRRRAIRILPIAALALASGCVFESDRYKTYPANPYTDLQVVAIMPFMNRTADARIDGVEMANIMASELAKFSGFRVVRPQMMRSMLEPGDAGKSDDEMVLTLARRAKADAVIVCAVTDYDPYNPPRIALSVQFLRASARRLSGLEIDRIVQSGSWRRGPLALSREKAGHWIAAFEDVYDAHEERIREEIVAYAQAQEASDSPFQGEREFLAVQSRYLQFVSNQVLNHLFEVTASHVP